MLVVLILWLLIFILFSIWGFIAVKILNLILKADIENFPVDIVEYFFIGFMFLSLVTGFLSIWIPINLKLLLCICLLSCLLFYKFRKSFGSILKDNYKRFTSFSKVELAFLSIVTLIILLSVPGRISLGDTESYHAQTIQWINKYSVVPGLGNIHGRLAFNSMFFVISGLFTFELKSALIFPLNGICFIMLLLKIFFLFSKHVKSGELWKSVFHILILLMSLLFFLPNLNSPSPDIICGILILFTLIYILEYEVSVGKFVYYQVIFISIVTFTCVTFKLSSVLLPAILVLFLKEERIKKLFIITLTGVIVLLPFLIRNFYLSGYLLYPFPHIDIFNVDWKIPYNNVIDVKLETENWAKISNLPFAEVQKMKIYQWVRPWFNALDFNNKILILFSVIALIMSLVMVFKKNFKLCLICLIVFINLAFWFLSAPDPRFAYGFLFFGLAISVAYPVSILINLNLERILKLGMVCLLVIIVSRRISYPVNTIINPSRWIIPAPFGTVEARNYNAGFEYRVPIPEGGCYNCEIPCVPYPLTNVTLRGANLQDGFRVIQKAK